MPPPPQQQHREWREPPCSTSAPPSFASAPPSFASPPPPPPVFPPPSPPALVVPRAGIMTLEERRAAFARAALRADASARAKELLFGSGKLSEGEQRTEEWHALRDARLTASVFGNALGFWPGGRASLWEEKVGLGKAFTGNAATKWGTEAEPRALEAYVAASQLEDSRGDARRRRRVSECRFEVLCEDDAHDWLGASPDGLIELVSAGGGGAEEEAPLSSPPSAAAFPSAALSDGAAAGGKASSGGGVLEIKCPFNRGSPREASPWRVPPHYYVPQVQGLMAITGREWCDLWCWTPEGGAAGFRFERDRGYWAQAFEVLADFWWAHVVPGSQAAAAAAASSGERRTEGQQKGGESGAALVGGAEALRRFRPGEEHPLTRSLVQRSKAMAERAAEDGPRRLSARELEEAIRRMK